MKPVVLRYLLTDGHILDVQTTESEARKFISDWGNPNYPLGREAFPDDPNRPHALDMSRVVGMLMIDPAAIAATPKDTIPTHPKTYYSERR